MASSGEPARNGKPESGVREREREREREWVPRESAQQHHRERERERDRDRHGEREPPIAMHPRERGEVMPPLSLPPTPPGGPNAPIAMNNNNNNNTTQPPQPPLSESGSGSFLSRIGGPYRSPPTASNSFRPDIGEQRSWPEDDWDGTRKRSSSGERIPTSRKPPFFFFLSPMLTRNDSFQTGRKTLWKIRLQA